MYIIAGLGNPGKKYENTRHNLGFLTLDRIADKLGVEVKKKKFNSLVGEGRIGSEKIILLKPQTFMNNSGLAIKEAVDYYSIDDTNLMVIYDDFDIPIGRIRIRKSGSSGTHNGMRSIVDHLGSREFPRIRIGIGSDSSGELMDYVLGSISKREQELLTDAIERASSSAICYVDEGIDIAMNRYNRQDGE